MKYRIMIETTNKCNAKCEFCPNSSLKREKVTMSDQVFNMIVQRLHEEKIEIERFILHLNGEPLIDRKLPLRISQLKSDFNNADVYFTTNFTLANDDLIEKIIDSGLNRITISLNAVGTDEYKKITGGLNYEKVLSNIQRLKEIHKEKKSELKVVLSIVESLDNKEQVRIFKERYEKDFEVRVIHIGQWINKKPPLKMDEREKGKKRICKDLLSQICILSNGEFALCCFDSEGSVGLNIMDTPILEAFYSDKYENLRKQQNEHGLDIEICRNCSFNY